MFHFRHIYFRFVGHPTGSKKRFTTWVFQAGLAGGMCILREDWAASWNPDIPGETSE